MAARSEAPGAAGDWTRSQPAGRPRTPARRLYIALPKAFQVQAARGRRRDARKSEKYFIFSFPGFEEAGTQGKGRGMREWKGISWEFPDSTALTASALPGPLGQPLSRFLTGHQRSEATELSRLAAVSFLARPRALGIARLRGFPRGGYDAQLPRITCGSPQAGGVGPTLRHTGQHPEN